MMRHQSSKESSSDSVFVATFLVSGRDNWSNMDYLGAAVSGFQEGALLGSDVTTRDPYSIKLRYLAPDLSTATQWASDAMREVGRYAFGVDSLKVVPGRRTVYERDSSKTSVVYRSLDERYRIERNTGGGGYSGNGWGLFDDDQNDPYMGTYSTKGEAIDALSIELGLSEFPVFKKSSGFVGNGVVPINNMTGYVGRGIAVMDADVSEIPMINKVLNHTITAQEMISTWFRGSVGNWWGADPEWDIGSVMDWAYMEVRGSWVSDYGVDEDYGMAGCGFAVVFVAKQPSSGFEDSSTPGWTYGLRPEGTSLSLVEIWYNTDGNNWYCLPASGMSVTT